MLSLQRKQTMMRRPPRSLKRQQGVVIVIALFVVGLVATMSYVMLARLARDTERTALSREIRKLLCMRKVRLSGRWINYVMIG